MPSTQYTLHLKGFVGGADFDRNYVDYILDKCKDKHVDVLIDSLGGSVATALSIASAFKNHADVSVHFVGMNASAATIASLGAKHISIDANAMYLVHKCSADFFEWGSLNADQFDALINDCEKIKADLNKLDLNIAQMYSAKCKKNHTDLLDLMKAGGWLTAREARDWGFVDEITDLPEEKAPRLTDAVASELATAGIPIPNIPMADKESSFAKFISSLASIFKPSKNDCLMTSEQNPTVQQAANNVATAADDAKRIADLEAQLATITAERDELAAQVSALKGAPGDSTTAVVQQNSAAATSEDPLAAYCRDMAEAKKMYNLLNPNP